MFYGSHQERERERKRGNEKGERKSDVFDTGAESEKPLKSVKKTNPGSLYSAPIIEQEMGNGCPYKIREGDAPLFKKGRIDVNGGRLLSSPARGRGER